MMARERYVRAKHEVIAPWPKDHASPEKIAERVRDGLLRATWFRPAVIASDVEGRWIVENGWSLTDEGLRSERFRGGRSLSVDPSARPWLQRLNLLTPRGGFARADLTLFRDGDALVLHRAPAPDDPGSPFASSLKPGGL